MKHAYILTFTLMASLLSMGMYTPAMPEIAHEFGTTVVMVQRTLTASFSGSLLAVIVAGFFADRWGRKRTLSTGLIIAVLGNVLMLFSPSIAWLIVGRFFQGIGVGASSVIGFSAIQELYSKEKALRIVGTLGTVNATVPAFAPMLGGYITAIYNWHMNFVVSLAIYVLCVFLVHFQLPEKLNERVHSSVREILRSFKTISMNRDFLTMVLQFPLFFSVVWFQTSFFPFYMQEEIGMTPDIYGIFIGGLTVWFAFGSFFGSRLIVRFGFLETLWMGFALVFVGVAILWITSIWFAHTVFMIALSMSVFRIGSGILFPGTSNEALSRFKTQRTRTSSLRSLFISIFALIGSYAAQVVDGATLSSMAIYVSAASVVAFGLFLAYPRTLVD